MKKSWSLGDRRRWAPMPGRHGSLRRDGMPVKCWGVPGMENQAESLEMALETQILSCCP